MFTGIIQEIGIVESLAKGPGKTVLCIRAPGVYSGANTSDSISINGACLTVTSKKEGLLFFDAVESTLEISSLGKLKKGERVNVEPALKVGDKLGGHFVLGHVDKQVRLRRLIRKSAYWRLEAELSCARQYMVENGSIALEGISLTIKRTYPRYFSLDIIPFTYEHTNLKYKKPGDWLNVEFDYLLKEAGRKK
ncbi:MAG: riboflavin synthase [Candidatus Omnitrophica bacterium]|nr:riboflavin synthase [Candidatus Omnitrophota bacterium]